MGKGTVIQQGKAAAVEVARGLAKCLGARKGWTPTHSAFEAATTAYGVVELLSLAENVTFSIWLDRSHFTGRKDVPMLAASFEASHHIGRALIAMMRAEGIPVRWYATQHAERASGYDGEPLGEMEGSDSTIRYLTCYAAPGEFDATRVVSLFERFFRQWRARVEGVLTLPAEQGALVERAERNAVLVGLLGELAVLVRLPDRAEWVGSKHSPHDIAIDGHRFEVKTSRGEPRPRLSLSQILQAPGQFLAIVEVGEKGVEILTGSGSIPRHRTDPKLVARADQVRAYMNSHRFRLGKFDLKRLSLALPHCDVALRRMSVPASWHQALLNLETHGRILDLEQQWPVDRMRKVKSPFNPKRFH